MALAYRDLAHKLAAAYNGPETTVALRKLLESRDAVLRAAGDVDCCVTQPGMELP